MPRKFSISISSLNVLGLESGLEEEWAMLRNDQQPGFLSRGSTIPRGFSYCRDVEYFSSNKQGHGRITKTGRAQPIFHDGYF